MHHSKRSVCLTCWAWMNETTDVKPDRLSVIMLLRIVWWTLIGLYLCLLESTWQPSLGSCSGWQTGAWLLGLLKPVGLWHSYWLDLSRVRGWTESGTCLVCFYYELFPSALCCMLGRTSSVRFRGLFKETVSIAHVSTVQQYINAHNLFWRNTNEYRCVKCIWI